MSIFLLFEELLVAIRVDYDIRWCNPEQIHSSTSSDEGSQNLQFQRNSLAPYFLCYCCFVCCCYLRMVSCALNSLSNSHSCYYSNDSRKAIEA